MNKATGSALQAVLSYYAQVRDNEIIITGSGSTMPSEQAFTLMVWEQTCMPMTCSFGE